MNPLNYLGKFNICPTRELFERVEKNRDKLLTKDISVNCPSVKSALFIGWAWLYVRDYSIPYTDINLGSYLESVLSHDEREFELKADMQTSNLIIIAMNDLYLTDYAKQTIPAILENRVIDPKKQTLILTVRGKEWVVPDSVDRWDLVSGSVRSKEVICNNSFDDVSF